MLHYMCYLILVLLMQLRGITLYLCYRVQNQVNEVIDVMRDNIGKVLDRGEKLSELEVKSGL